MKRLLGVALFLTLSTRLQAAGVSGEIEEITVTGEALALVLLNDAEAASVGTVLPQQIVHRPILRPAEIIETIPGMVITQHSGGGKANQYFLRGFNLDHSTDFANFVEGVPVNMVSHGHGQGYSDLNFLIPELLERLVYKKGPYSAEGGDFSSAGSAHIVYKNQLNHQQLKFTLGEDGYRRGLMLGGLTALDGDWVYALSNQHNDGPWTKPDNLRRDNLFLKYSRGDKHSGLSASGLYFDSHWTGTDQIPKRLVEQNTLNRFDTLDDTTGGNTHRYQLAFQHWKTLSANSRVTSNLYWVDYKLNLSGNFTYFANDAVDGDQVTQFDDRTILGGGLRYEKDFSDHQLHLGGTLRWDDIADVGVGRSIARQIKLMDSRASIDELSHSLYASVNSQWAEKLTTITGLRFDHYRVKSVNKLNNFETGSADDSLISPKLSVRLGPFASSQIFINYGRGFHSNDARGVVAGEVPLLSQSEGYELGFTNNSFSNLQLSLVVFKLDLDSELVFVGDDGTTEAKDASHRRGFEFSAFYQPLEALVLDADYTSSEAKFSEGEFDGLHVPDSVEDVFSAGMSLESRSGLYGGLRLRYFGPRKLTEDGERESDATSVVNANIGYQLAGFSLSLEILNLLDQDDDDITYWYESRPSSEANVEEDYHAHPMIPRTLRFTVGYEF